MQVPLHSRLQSPEQVFIHVCTQALSQELLHVPEHALHPATAADAEIGNCDRTTAPITGNAAFAADLKNSRRDCSSSFLFVFIVVAINRLSYTLSIGGSDFSKI